MKKPSAEAEGFACTDLMRHGAESVTEELFPRQVKMGEATFPLAYRFEPGHAFDAFYAALERIEHDHSP